MKKRHEVKGSEEKVRMVQWLSFSAFPQYLGAIFENFLL